MHQSPVEGRSGDHPGGDRDTEHHGLIAGRYQLRGVLGYGGMAEVRDAWDLRLARAVAIKLLSPSVSARPDMMDRFRAEARTAASLNHPNIVAIFDSGDHAGTPYIVMERLPGATLADEIARGPMSSARLRAILDDVLGAMATAHSAGVLHRDIKPGNILLTASGPAVKVADFGISKTIDSAYTRTGEILGTMAYLSPERISGAPASATDDLYAVGVVAYEALTGFPPFRSDNLGALARSIMDEQPLPVTEIRADADPDIVAVIERAMSRDARCRYGSAAQMRAAVRAQSAFRPATKVLASPFPEPPASLVYIPPPRRRWSRRSKALLGVGATIATLTTMVVLAALDSPPTGPSAPPATSVAVTTEPVTSPAPPTPAASTPAQPPRPADAPPRPGNNGHGNGKKDNKG